MGIIVLSLRFVQGWIFWGGGSRRFIYDPNKLDPYSTQWMANKLQSAMPGALLGLEQAISFLLQHFLLLYSVIILFSLAELFSGLALMFGLFTRLAAFVTVLISIALMFIFGWQGTTCMDEWTMAVASLAIGLTLMLSGSSVYSLDAWWVQKKQNLLQKKWFLVLASGPWPFQQLKPIALSFALFAMVFTLLTYNYYRGAIFGSYHAGPVSADVYHLKLSNGTLKTNGTIQFTAYVNAGPAAAPTYIIRVELLDLKGKVIEDWNRKQLITKAQIKNQYDYNQMKIGPYGIIAPVSAKATVRLPPASSRGDLLLNSYLLQVITIDGRRYELTLNKDSTWA